MKLSSVLPLFGLLLSSLSNATPIAMAIGSPDFNSSSILSQFYHSGASAGAITPRDFVEDEYGHTFIAMTPKNLVDSGVQNWYDDWVRDARANNSDMYNKYGEVNYFGMVFLEDEDYHCGIALKGCNRRPAWPEILDMNPEDVELARRIYFITKLQTIVNLVIHIVYDATLAAQIAADGLIPKIILTFTEQADKNADENCKILKDAIKGLITFTIDVGIMALTDSPEMEKFFGADNEEILKIFDKPWTTLLVTKTWELAKGQTSTPLSHAFDQSNICADFGGNFDPKNEQHVTELRIFMDNVVMDFRAHLAASADGANTGSTKPENGGISLLSDLMFVTAWADEGLTLNIIKNPSILEKKFKTLFTQYLISTAARSSQCYMKCNTQILAEEYTNDARDGMHDYRISPRPNKVCQLQCLTQVKKPGERKMYGFDELAKDPWNIDIKTEMHNAYESYKKFGNHDAVEQWDLKPNKETSYFRLPVCDSNVGYVDITDFERGDENQNEVFPISCGDWRSDEMPAFIEFLDMQVGGEAQKSGRLEHLYQYVVPKEIDTIIKWPLDHFLAYCQLNIRFYQREGNSFLKNINEIDIGRSKFCDQVKKNTQYMPHFQANLEFCTGDDKSVLLAEGNRISTDFINLSNTRHHCGKLMDFLSEDHHEYAGVAEAQKKWDQFKKDNLWSLGLDGW